jgi:CRISPR-associated protein Csm3
MHSRMFCEMALDFNLRPRGPLLVRSGDEDPLDPTLPDMQFVRTYNAVTGSSTVFIPGSSVKGVVRSHAERLVRSQNSQAACDPLRKVGSGGMRGSCSFSRSAGPSHRLSGNEAYKSVCYTCRVFGSSALASRALFSDLMPDLSLPPILGERKGVAIDRVTGGTVRGGLYEMEILEDGLFSGRLMLSNFTIGQLGLLGGALLDLSDGLVPIGFGKSKGLGRVSLEFCSLRFRYPVPTGGLIWGVANVGSQEVVAEYGLGPLIGEDGLSTPTGREQRRGLYTVAFESDDAIRVLLENAVNRWPEEVAALPWVGGNDR